MEYPRVCSVVFPLSCLTPALLWVFYRMQGERPWASHRSHLQPIRTGRTGPAESSLRDEI